MTTRCNLAFRSAIKIVVALGGGILLSGCAPVPDLEDTLTSLSGEPVSNVANWLGTPDEKSVEQDQPVYRWQNRSSYRHNTGPVSTDGGFTFSASVVQTFACDLKAYLSEDEKTVERFDIIGDSQACGGFLWKIPKERRITSEPS